MVLCFVQGAQHRVKAIAKLANDAGQLTARDKMQIAFYPLILTYKRGLIIGT